MNGSFIIIVIDHITIGVCVWGQISKRENFRSFVSMANYYTLVRIKQFVAIKLGICSSITFGDLIIILPF